MVSENKNIVITTGGTAGHIYPALATLQQLHRKGYNAYIVTDIRGQKQLASYDNELLSRIFVVSSSSPSVGNKIKRLLSIFKIIKGIFQSLVILRRYNIVSCVGFGSYASAPTLIAAIILGRSIILHEQNAFIGKVNRILARWAKIIGLSYENTVGLENSKFRLMQYVGVPLRKELIELHDKYNNRNSLVENHAENKIFKILVTGGSQGAAIFAKVIPEAIFSLSEELRKQLCVVMQVREENISEVSEKFAKYPEIKFEVASFYDDMPTRMLESDLVICRAGSSTLAEICFLGKASILIPYPLASDNHQYYNAKTLVDIKATICLQQGIDFNVSNLHNHLQLFISDRKLIKQMGDSAHSLSKSNSAEKMAELVIKTLIHS